MTLRRTYGNDRGALLFVRLRVEDGELVAEYSSYPRLPWEDEGKQEYAREVIAKNVRSIRFLYAEEVDEEIEFEDTWEEDDHEAPPLAIQMTVEWERRNQRALAAPHRRLRFEQHFRQSADFGVVG